MPYRLDTHVLTVDANVIHKVDTANPANLYSMWTVFSRCADSVEQGRRLENLSWRLWQREQLVESEGNPALIAHTNTNTTTVTYNNNSATNTLPQNIPSDHRLPELPQLSGSVDSVVDDEAVEFTSVSAPMEIARPRIVRLDSSVANRSRRDRHISSDDVGKMIVSIVKDKTPLSAPTHTSPTMAPRKEVPRTTPALERSGSTTTDSQSPSKDSDRGSDDSHSGSDGAPRTTVVRGFSVSPATYCQPAKQTPAKASTDAIPEPRSSPAPKPVLSKKQNSMFTLGGSCSSSEQGHSVDNRSAVAPVAVNKKTMFKLGGSSEEDDSVKSTAPFPQPPTSMAKQKKQATFGNVVATQPSASEAAVDSDSDYIDESAVDESAIDDDDDCSDWEDSEVDSGKASIDDKLFKRIDSKANLTSRPSLITLMLAQSERAKNLGNHASQSTSAIPKSRGTHGHPLGVSPNDSDEAPLMMKGVRHSNLKPIHEGPPRTSAQPITATPNHVHAQAALSPRTTRRNMLATELTESLRRHLLWERQQKSSTANAVLKRRHTSHDVANLKQFPERACMKQSEDVNASSWNQYFSKEAFNNYHSKGW
ncbi:hypothetical protein S7711_03223 [Stachybotrys chartarum IBT 7711]|uniref:Uncharacterized protein n=1 Tax=Stachybotrys chartarum (strain CBS 109288 / IBT 7711) TaxID=1280523 RepID=A0A084AZJ8_STACB|nr:hypothetical protein S7711_03223 [Stachybotrys chartarum IBT 7711]